MKRCFCCEKDFWGTFILMEGKTYCMQCWKKEERCAICESPSRDIYILPDKRGVCKICCARGVYTNEQLVRVYNPAWDATHTVFQIPLRTPRNTVKLVDLSELNYYLMLMQNNNANKRCFGLTQVSENETKIFLLKHLPRKYLLVTILHELGHALQDYELTMRRHPMLVEGISEFVCYKVLQKSGCEQEAKRLLDKRDVYGAGLRYCLFLERIKGWRRFVRFAFNY